MLTTIAKTYGGLVRRITTTSAGSKVGEEKFVQWVINDRKIFFKTIIPLFDQYPPLTSRMKLQYLFFRKFFFSSQIEEYFIERNFKYKNRELISPLFCWPTTPSYFKEWLAGFIEAEGSFSNRVKGNYSFSIGQNHDYYLIEAIRNYFGLSHLTISNKKGKLNNFPSQKAFYEFSVGSGYGTGKVIDHCTNLLQGYKYYQLAVFIQKSKIFQDRLKDFLIK